MPRIQPIDQSQVQGQLKETFDGINKKMGMVPNLFKTLAHSPAALNVYLGSTAALSQGVLDPKLRQQIAVATAGINHCDYCASAHTLIGKAAGVSESEIKENLRGLSSNPKTQTALNFVKKIVELRGRVSDADLAEVRQAGYNDAEIIEIIAHVALNIFTNYTNNLTRTTVDFPLVSTGEVAAV